MAASRAEIYEQVKGVLVELLGIDEDQITGKPPSRRTSTPTLSISSS